MNFIDTAEVYGYGASESIVGELLGQTEEDLVIATKYFPNRDSADTVRPACEASLERLGSVSLPALIMHGEWDEIIPFEQGQVIFENIGSTDKELVAIPRAGHNDIMLTGMERYFTSISRFVNKHSG